jgi:hypothetical protein
VIRDVGVRDAGSKGRGVFARRAFEEGEFIFRRRHTRVFGGDELDRAGEWERIHLCELGFDRFAVLAPPGCYLNHFCDPNAMRHSVKVFAWHPIAEGDEITIDYRLNAFDSSSWPCNCGSETCTGVVVGSFFAMDRQRQKLLLLTPPPSFVASTGAVDGAEPPARLRQMDGAPISRGAQKADRHIWRSPPSRLVAAGSPRRRVVARSQWLATTLAAMGSLIVVTGPPGAGKSAVAQVLAREAEHSVVVQGDSFFGFLASGAVDPWLPGSHDQNTVVTRAAAAAAGALALGGYATVYDGVVGPWFLPTFGAATHLGRLDYVILLPSVDICVRRVATRRDHGFTDDAATRKMHAEFVGARVAERHVLCDRPQDAAKVAVLIESARAAGELNHTIR